MNAAKLESHGIDKVRAACIIHAEKAITYRNQPDKAHLFELHVNLLDQCGVVGRRLLGREPRQTSVAKDLEDIETLT